MTVVAGVIHAARFSIAQCRDTDTRQIIGMDVVGVAVLAGDDARRALLQAVQRDEA